VHTWIFSKRVQELGSTMMQMLVMETMLSSAFVWRKTYSTNTYNLNDLCGYFNCNFIIYICDIVLYKKE
jgi:hypothetical protein